MTVKPRAVLYPGSETNLLAAGGPGTSAASRGRTAEESPANPPEAASLCLESPLHSVRKPAVIRALELAHGQ